MFGGNEMKESKDLNETNLNSSPEVSVSAMEKFDSLVGDSQSKTLEANDESMSSMEKFNMTLEDEVDTNNLEPNSYCIVNGERVRTDDNGKIHMKYNPDTKIYELLPNNTYEVNGYRYETDDKGRIIKVEGQLKLKEEKRSVINTNVKDMKDGDERGHLIGDQFGGSNLVDNLVPMGFDVNRSDYKKLEEKLAKEVADGKDVYVNMRVEYGDDTNRPSKFTVEYTIREEFFETSFINYEKGENQNV